VGSAARLSTGAKRVVGIDRRWKQRFSASRSWATASALSGGAMRVPRAARRSASTLMFSQSKLMTSLRRASSASSARSWNSPASSGAMRPAGVSALRSKNRKSRPSG
jgi:hypothetical protein